VIIAKITAVVFAVFFLISFAVWGVCGISNFSASFVAFSLVALSSFIGYKRLIFASRQSEQPKDDDEEEVEGEEKLSKTAVLLKTYKGWLFPFRLISYAIFVLVFLYFSNNGLLNIGAFLSGIAVLPLSALVFILFFRREF
jgi:uncharacterized protein YqhQ